MKRLKVACTLLYEQLIFGNCLFEIPKSWKVGFSENGLTHSDNPVLERNASFGAPRTGSAFVVSRRREAVRCYEQEFEIANSI